MSLSESSAFSVVIPTHDGRTSVRRAIDSVLAQCHQGFELIVVSDGEGELTRRVLNDLTDPRVHILEQPKRGSAAARNLGLAAARNPWVAFLDDDDLARPHWLASFHALIGESTLAITGGVAYWRGGTQRGTRMCRLSLVDPTMSASTLLAGGFAVRRDLLRAIGGYDEGLKAAENQDLGLRLCDYINAAGVDGVFQHIDNVVVDVYVDGANARSVRYGTSWADASRIFLGRHANRLREDPHSEASLLRIISRSDRANGQIGSARAASFRAFRLESRNPQNLKSVALAAVPALDRLAGRQVPRRVRLIDRLRQSIGVRNP